MTELIKRLYVVDFPNDGLDMPLVTKSLERANNCTGGSMRMFVEEVPWVLAPPPDNTRLVLVLYRHRSCVTPDVIVGQFGLDGKWLTRGHDYSSTYLDDGTVLGWRELPEVPGQFTRPQKP